MPVAVTFVWMAKTATSGAEMMHAMMMMLYCLRRRAIDYYDGGAALEVAGVGEIAGGNAAESADYEVDCVRPFVARAAAAVHDFAAEATDVAVAAGMTVRPWRANDGPACALNSHRAE